MPDEIRYIRKYDNTSMSAGDMNFDDIYIGMNVNSLLYSNDNNHFSWLFLKV